MKKLFQILLLFFFVARIGEYVTLRNTGFTTNSAALMYCGMVSDKVFSISNEEYRFTANLYYPATTKRIKFHGIELQILKVTPEYMTFEIIKE